MDYAVAVDSNHLVVRDIPYLDSEGGLQTGAIVAKLEFIDQVQRVTQTESPSVLRRVGAPRLGRRADPESWAGGRHESSP